MKEHVKWFNMWLTDVKRQYLFDQFIIDFYLSWKDT